MAKNPFDDGLMEDSVETIGKRNPFDDGLMQTTTPSTNPFDDGLMDMPTQSNTDIKPTYPNNDDIVLDALAENIIADGPNPLDWLSVDLPAREGSTVPVTMQDKYLNFMENQRRLIAALSPVSVLDNALSFFGPGAANFIIGGGGGALMNAVDKIINPAYSTDEPKATTQDYLDRMRGYDAAKYSQEMPSERSLIRHPEGMSPIGALMDEAKHNPAKLDPIKQARAAEFAKQTKAWAEDWQGEAMRQHLTPDQIAAYEQAAQENPALYDYLRYGTAFTEAGKDLQDSVVHSLMSKLDKAAATVADAMADPNDPRDAEMYKNLIFFAGPHSAKAAVKATAMGISKAAYIAEMMKTYAKFAVDFKRDPIGTAERAIKFSDMTPIEAKAFMAHMRKTFSESDKVVHPVLKANEPAVQRAQREKMVADMVAEERSRLLPIEEFNDFFTHRANLPASERAAYLERGRQAKSVAELDAMFTEYSDAKLTGRKKGSGEVDAVDSSVPNKLSSMPMFDPARWREFARFVGWGKKTKGKQLLDQLLAKGIKQSDLKYLGWYDYLTAIKDRIPEAKKMWELGKGRLDVVKKDLGTRYEGYSGFGGVDYKETGYTVRPKPTRITSDFIDELRFDMRETIAAHDNQVQKNWAALMDSFDALKVTEDNMHRRLTEMEQKAKSYEGILPQFILDDVVGSIESVLAGERGFEQTSVYSKYTEPHYASEGGNNLLFHTRNHIIPDNSNAYKYINDLVAKEAPFVKRHVASFLDDMLPLDSTLDLIIERLETIKEGPSQGPKRKAQLAKVIAELNKYFPEDINYYAIEEIQSVWKKDFEQGNTKVEPPLRQAYVDVALGDITRQAKEANQSIIWQHPKYFKESVGMSLRDADKLYGPKGAIAKYFKREYNLTPELTQIQGKDSYLVPIKNIKMRDSAWSEGYRKLLDWIQIDPNTLGTMFANIDLMKTIELGARRNQVTIEQYMTQSGMAPARAKQLAKQVTKSLKRSYDLGMIEPRIIMHNKDPWAAKAEAGIGIVLNEQARKYVRKDNGPISKTKRDFPAPAVSEELVRGLKDAVNKDFNKGGKKNPRYYIKNPMQSLVDALGDFGKKYIYEPILDATAAQNRHKIYIHEQLEQHIKSLKLKPAQLERIGNYAMSIQHKGVERLQAMHETPVLWRDLTPAERVAFDSLAPFYEHMYELSNQARIKSGYAPFQRVKNYTPLQMVSMLAEAAVDDIALWRKETGWLKENARQMKKPSWAFKRGVIPRKGTYYELNILSQMKRHADSVLWHHYLSPVVAHTHEMLGKHNVTNLPGWEQKINPKTGQPAKVTSWSIRKEAPDAYHAIAEYANSVHSRYIKRKLPRPVSQAMLTLKNNIAFSWLSLNMQTILNQMGSMVNTLSMSEPLSLSNGIAAASLPHEWKSALRESRFLRERIGSTTELFSGVADMYGQGGRIRRTYRKVKDATMVPMQFVDAYNAMVAWQTGKFYGESYHGLKGMDAIRFADEFAVKTQASNLAVHRPPIMRTDIGSVFTTLQTFHLNQFNVLLDDVFAVRNNRHIVEKTIQPLLLGMGVAAMNTLYQDVLNTYSPFWSPIDAFCDTIEESGHESDAVVAAFVELLQAAPFIGGGKYQKGLGGPAWVTVSEAAGMQGLHFKKNFVAEWNKNADNGYDKWENFQAMLAHPTIVSALRMTGLPLANQLSKWARIAKRAEMNGEDIPPFNKILGSTYKYER